MRRFVFALNEVHSQVLLRSSNPRVLLLLNLSLFEPEYFKRMVSNEKIHNELISCVTQWLEGKEDNIIAKTSAWLQFNHDGFYIQDLDIVCHLIDVLIEPIGSQKDGVSSVLGKILNVCEKPLLELKANERLSAKGMGLIERYFSKLSCLWPVLSSSMKIQLGKCFRSIANGGHDPTALKPDNSHWKTDDQKMRVTDRDYIHKHIRDSSALEAIVSEFVNCAECLNYDLIDTNSFLQASQDETENPSFEVYDAAFYGVPISTTESTVDPSASSNPMEKANEILAAESCSVMSRADSQASMDGEKPSVLRELTQVLLDLSLDLSPNQSAAALMCELRIMDGALVLIEKDSNFNPRDPRITYIIELMWNVLEHFIANVKNSLQEGEKLRTYLDQYDFIMDFEKAVEVLQKILNYRLIKGYKLADREIRNEIIIILTMIAQFPSSAVFFTQSGLLSLLVTYACVEEEGKDSWDGFIDEIANFRNFSTPSDVDFEFKKGLWFLISEVLRAKNIDALNLVATSPLMSSIMQYIEYDSFDRNSSVLKRSDIDETQYSASSVNEISASEGLAGSKSSADSLTRSFNPSYLDTRTAGMSFQTIKSTKKKSLMSLMTLSKLREFQQLGATFLLLNAPDMLYHFEQLDGPARIVGCTLSFVGSDITEHKNVVFYSLMLLQKCLNHSDKVRAFIEDHGLIQTFLSIYNNAVREETQAQCVRLIASMCYNGNTTSQQQFLELDGIPLLVAPLVSYVEKRQPLVGKKAGVKFDYIGGDSIPDPLENPFGGDISVKVIAIMDCIRAAVVGNEVNELKFADFEGLDVLLDLLETSPFVLRIQVLRIIADLAINPKLLVYINAWRSPKTLRSAGQILCHYWMDEEARIIGEKRPNGVLADPSHPLGHPDVSMSEGNDASSVSSGTVSSFGRAMGLGLNETGTSVTVLKLATAILAGRNANETNLPVHICNEALEKDARVMIATVVKTLGLLDLYDMSKVSGSKEHKSGGSKNLEDYEDEDDLDLYDSGGDPVFTPTADLGLSSQDRQVLAMAKLYNALREGEWWQEVRDSAVAADVTPIEADKALMESRLKYSKDAGVVVQIEQQILYAEDQKMKKAGENHFMGQIITKKDQQIKAEWLKKFGKNTSSNAPKRKKRVVHA